MSIVAHAYPYANDLSKLLFSFRTLIVPFSNTSRMKCTLPSVIGRLFETALEIRRNSALRYSLRISPWRLLCRIMKIFASHRMCSGSVQLFLFPQLLSEIPGHCHLSCRSSTAYPGAINTGSTPMNLRPPHPHRAHPCLRSSR